MAGELPRYRRVPFRLILPDHAKPCDRCGEPIQPGEVMMAVPCTEVDPEVRCYDVVHTPRCPGWRPRVLDGERRGPPPMTLPFLVVAASDEDGAT
jgi:hypothetical protein